MAFLLLQDTFGPRFFLPKGLWFAELDTWDYHPILPPSDIENPAGFGDSDKKDVDCVICFEKIELAGSARRDSIDARTSEKGDEAGASGAVGDVFDAARRGASRMSYMVSWLSASISNFELISSAGPTLSPFGTYGLSRELGCYQDGMPIVSSATATILAYVCIDVKHSVCHCTIHSIFVLVKKAVHSGSIYSVA